MADTAKPVFLVDDQSDPVMVRIDGRASFQNSGALHDFLTQQIQGGKRRFVIDFKNCTTMDSTFLGVVAGAALQLRKLSPPGSLVLARMGTRNRELVNNLGLHRLVTMDPASAVDGQTATQALPTAARDELESARLVLQAHENLIATDEANQGKFKDVLTFLRARVEQK